MVEKILDVFSKSAGYDIALMTTFNFDIDFFERTVLNRLYDNNVKKVSLFVDSYELNKALSETTYTSMGKKYHMNPVEMKEAFHPKLILLLGDNSAQLVVASANITINGYLKNNEIFNVFQYDDKHQENLKVINAAISFFEELNSNSQNPDTAIFDEIKNLIYYGKTNINNELFLLQNINKSILSQITDIVVDAVEINVAVPYYDNYLGALEALHENYPDAKINLYIQNRKSKFPIEYKDNDYISNIFAFDKCNDSAAFYHGKVFRFITTEATYFLYGSANCTKSALVKTKMDNGNVECCILEKGEENDFDAFFDNFNIIGDVESLQCDLLSFETDNNSNFFYRYGMLKDEIILFFGYSKKVDSLKIFYNDIELDWVYDDKNLIVHFPVEIIATSDLLQINIMYDDKQEQFNCWYTDYAALSFNRIKTLDEKLFAAVLYNDDDEKYIDDVRTILEAMSLSLDDAIKEKFLLKKIKNSTKANDDDEDYDDGEGIISYVIPETSEISQFKKYEHIEKAFKLPCLQAFNELFELHINENRHIDDNTIWNRKEVTARESRGSEYRFKNFIKSRVRQMLNPEYVAYVTLDHYIFCVDTVLNVFDKYSLKEHVTDMFDYEYLIKTRLAFMEAIVSKALTEGLPDDIRNAFFILICQMILESNKQIYKCDMDEVNVVFKYKTIFKDLNNTFEFRDFLPDYVGAALDRINKQIYLYKSYADAIKSVDDIFGYLKKDKLDKIIRMDYGDDAVVVIDDDKIIIQAQTESIKDFMIPRELTIAELKKYYFNSGYGRFLKIEVENIAPVPENSGYAYIIAEDIDFKVLSRTQRITQKNGVKRQPGRTKI